ncbi:MAG: pyruvate, water dikinase regulatory protein [Tepidisphaeraceae bacterium]
MPTKKPAPLRVIHLLSDSTGNLAKHMLTAFLTQFPDGTFEVHYRNFLSTTPKLEQALGRVEATPGIVLHALVTPEAKKRVHDFCKKKKLPFCDLTGSFVDFIADASGVDPQRDVKRLHEVSDAYQARIRALEFTIEHDDGLGLDTLHEADVVLTGVSRTSKTPTSIYLGQQGYRAANVALAIQSPPPEELLRLPGTQVVGLLIDPLRLFEVRRTRQKGWAMDQTNYNDMDEIEKEVNWSKRLFHKHGWPTLDVTHTAVEETAAKIIELLKLHKKAPTAH